MHAVDKKKSKIQSLKVGIERVDQVYMDSEIILFAMDMHSYHLSVFV